MCVCVSGGLADGVDAPARLHGVGDARRHGPARARGDHAPVPHGLLARAHHHRPARARHRRAAGLLRHQLRPAHQPRELYTPVYHI